MSWLFVLIQFKQISLARGSKILFQDANFQIHAGHKVGLIGANGTGKSSLFALLLGLCHQESGDLWLPPDWVVAHMAQEVPLTLETALAFTLAGDAELCQTQHALALAEQAHDGEKIAELHQTLADIDGYAAQARAASLLNGLGFSQVDLTRPVDDFSGGWRVRLNLARALMCRSDLLLLDEPTNHLDLDAIIWLENWLREYRGTLLLISHDRDFLDNVVNRVLQIEQQTITFYRGGYSDFERQRAEKLALQQALFEKQQRKIAHIQSYIDRFRVQATKARQAQSRIKALERMERIAAAHVDSEFNFSFLVPASAPEPLLVLDDAATGYGEICHLKNVKLILNPATRLGLLGKNGAGKSTLVKMLVSELPLLAGKQIKAKELKIGYFAQHQLEQLRLDESPLQHLQTLDSETREQDFLNFLGGFNFKGEMTKTEIRHFSGGEKSRLALALLIWQKPNLLLLDEPTNHLDLDMRDALSLALQDFQGGVVLVSHDRALLRATCSEFGLVNAGEFSTFDGDLDDYKTWLETTKREENAASQKAESSSKTNSYVQNKADRQARVHARRPILKQIEQTEQNMAKWQQEKTPLDQRLGEGDLYEANARDELQNVLKRQAELAQQLALAEQNWLELQAELEALPLLD